MIKIANNAGFCFGVRRGADTVEELIKNKTQGEVICTLGKLIHNEKYNEYLEKSGVFVLEVDKINEVFENAKNGAKTTVVTRTHGVEADIQTILEKCAEECDSFKVVDCTCPYVKKIHKIAGENSGENQIFILIGQKEHPEVKSIISYAKNESHVFLNGEELEEYLKSAYYESKELIMAAQTTQKLSEWKKCQKIIKKYCTNAKIFDTICSVTEKRQNEVALLSKECDVMLVVGGKKSSNTKKLAEISSHACECTFLIERADDIDQNEIVMLCKESLKVPGSVFTVGITAGASTPDDILEEVKVRIAQMLKCASDETNT